MATATTAPRTSLGISPRIEERLANGELTQQQVDDFRAFLGRVERELQAEGYPVVRSPYTFGFAAVHAIRIHDDGLDGGADPGHDGVVIAV